MLAKLCMVIMTMTLAAASILTVRQQRLDAVYEMARAVERASAHDRKLQEVRIDIARRVTPQSVHTLAQRVGPFQPIPSEWSDPLIAVLQAKTVQDVSEVAEASPMQIEHSSVFDHEVGDAGRTTFGPAFGMEGAQ